MEMIWAALEEGDLRTRCCVVPLKDINRNAVWVSHLKSMVPSFDVVFSNNPLVVRLFSEAEVEVRNPPLYRRDIYSGTAIRRLMLDGGDWAALVPEPVALLIAGIGGPERLVQLSGSDSSHRLSPAKI